MLYWVHSNEHMSWYQLCWLMGAFVFLPTHRLHCFTAWELLCQKQILRARIIDYIPETQQISRAATSNYMYIPLIRQISRAGTSNYITQTLWDVITCPWPWYLPLTDKLIYILLRAAKYTCRTLVCTIWWLIAFWLGSRYIMRWLVRKIL